MEAIIFCGIQATGKTTYYVQHFLRTHIRISMDMLHTRNKENRLMQACLDVQQPFVIDNTNPSCIDREKYITEAKARKYKITGYYFQSKLEDAIERNNIRTGKEHIVEKGIRGTYNKLEVPTLAEGFDELYYVEISADGFLTKTWKHEI